MNGEGFGPGSVIMIGLGCAAIGYLSGVDAEIKPPENEDAEAKQPGRIHRSAKWLKDRWAQKLHDRKTKREAKVEKTEKTKKTTPPTVVTSHTIKQVMKAAQKHGINPDLVQEVFEKLAEAGVPGGEQEGWDMEVLAELVKEKKQQQS